MKSTSKQSHVAAAVLAAGVLGLAASSAFAQERNPERNAYFGEITSTPAIRPTLGCLATE